MVRTQKPLFEIAKDAVNMRKLFGYVNRILALADGMVVSVVGNIVVRHPAVRHDRASWLDILLDETDQLFFAGVFDPAQAHAARVAPLKLDSRDDDRLTRAASARPRRVSRT